MRHAKTAATVPKYLFEICLELKCYCLDMRVCTVDHLIKVHHSTASVYQYCKNLYPIYQQTRSSGANTKLLFLSFLTMINPLSLL